MGVSEHVEEHLELCAALALGAITARDRESLAQHIAEGCPECEAALADYERAAVLLAASVPPAMPRPEVLEQLMQKVESGSNGKASDADASPRATGSSGSSMSARPAPSRPASKVIPLAKGRSFEMPEWGWMAAAAGFAVTTLLMGVWAFQLGGDVRRLREELSDNGKVIASLNEQLGDEQHWSEVMTSPESRFAVLSATPSADLVMRGRVTFNPTTQRAVVVFENLRPTPGKAYELWAIFDTTPTSLGMIQTDDSGRAIVRIEKIGDPNHLVAFAVSLENPGGSPNKNAPAGPVVLLGKV
jgi:anti-sigma-K factor RskA